VGVWGACGGICEGGAHGPEFICFLCPQASFNSLVVSLPVHVFLVCTVNLQKSFILDFKLSIWKKV